MSAPDFCWLRIIYCQKRAKFFIALIQMVIKNIINATSEDELNSADTEKFSAQGTFQLKIARNWPITSEGEKDDSITQ